MVHTHTMHQSMKDAKFYTSLTVSFPPTYLPKAEVQGLDWVTSYACQVIAHTFVQRRTENFREVFEG